MNTTNNPAAEMHSQPTPPTSTYVDTTIKKVADTPMEGTDSVESMTYGPFSNEKATVATKKPKNKKAKFVRFLEPGEDPIEKAFDSIFLFIDDVREASNTARECGTKKADKEDARADKEEDQREEEYVIVDNGREDYDDDDDMSPLDEDDSESGFRPSLECVTEGLCRNPCTEGFSGVPPPADMMLSVTDENVSKTTQEEEMQKTDSASEKRKEYSLEKENSVKDMTSLADEDDVECDDIQARFERFVEKLRSIIHSVLPEDCKENADEILEKFSNTFTVEAGDVAGGVQPREIDPSVKQGVDPDPIVEAFDRAFLFFDEFPSYFEQLQQNIDSEVQSYRDDIQPYTVSLQPYIAELEARLTELQKSFLDLHEHLAKQKVAAMKQLEELTGYEFTDGDEEAAPVPQKRFKPVSMQMSAEEYAEALESAASLLSQSAPEEDLKKYSQEELHRRAVERIMAEKNESEEEGFAEYKTEEMILAELVKGADQTIMNSRSEEEEKQKKKKKKKPSTKEQLVVLGHSATLTPIPESDEASAGTPTFDKIEEGVNNGTLPAVPLYEDRNELSEDEPAPAPKVFPSVAVEKHQARDAEESDILVRAIDGMFLCYDDIEEQRPCKAMPCFGASVPSDLVDSVDDIIEREDDINEKDEAKEAEELREDEARLLAGSTIKPRPDEPEMSEGQRMLQKALQVLQEVPRDEMSPDEMRISNSLEDKKENKEPQAPPSKAVGDLMSKLALVFSDAKVQAFTLDPFNSAVAQKDDLAASVNSAYQQNEELRNALNSPREMTKLEFEIPESLKHPSPESCIAWGGDDSELMASINADRKLSEIEHENIFRDVSKGMQESSGHPIYNAPAFTEGNSGSADLAGDERIATPTTRAAVNALCGASSTEQRQQLIV